MVHHLRDSTQKTETRLEIRTLSLQRRDVDMRTTHGRTGTAGRPSGCHVHPGSLPPATALKKAQGEQRWSQAADARALLRHEGRGHAHGVSQYIKDALMLGSFVLPVAVSSLVAVHFANEHRDRFIDDLTSPKALLYLGIVTACAALRETFRRAARRRR
jgi:hypothetical protein